jgi:hypothetical protein
MSRERSNPVELLSNGAPEQVPPSAESAQGWGTFAPRYLLPRVFLDRVASVEYTSRFALRSPRRVCRVRRV